MSTELSNGNRPFADNGQSDRHSQSPGQTPTGPHGQGLGFGLWRAANAWQRAINLALEPLGLTHVQFFLLAALAKIDRADGAVTQATLARQASIDEMMTSQVVRILAAKGLLERHPHPTDARAVSLGLTESGSRLVVEATEAARRAESGFFAPLDNRIELLADGLARVVPSG